jgi:thiol:disulfide interchange protein DsbA
MPIRTRAFSWALLALLSMSLSAQPVADRDYTTLATAQPADSPGKIEVIEFFSYGCPHCSEFYPLVSSWSAKLPKDVVFKRVATGFGRPAWTNLAKAYYALEATGNLQKLDGALFKALHEQKLPLGDEKSIAEWVGKQGVDAGKFTAAFESFGVNAKITRSEEMVANYHVEGIPTLAVAGQYVVLGHSFEEILHNTDEVITKARAEAGQNTSASRGK